MLNWTNSGSLAGLGLATIFVDVLYGNGEGCIPVGLYVWTVAINGDALITVLLNLARHYIPEDWKFIDNSITRSSATA